MSFLTLMNDQKKINEDFTQATQHCAVTAYEENRMMKLKSTSALEDVGVCQ